MTQILLFAVLFMWLTTPVRADDFIGQTQRYFQNNQGHNNQDAYEQGRQDQKQQHHQWRQQQQQQHRDHYYDHDRYP